MFTERQLDVEAQHAHLMERLAESVLEMSESQILSEAREAGEDPSALARRTRALLAAQVSVQRQRPLLEAMEEYQRQVREIRSRTYALPDSADGRRDLMASLFHRYPQMHSAFLTVQHRDFKTLSDADIETFLKQLCELGVMGDGGEESVEEAHDEKPGESDE